MKYIVSLEVMYREDMWVEAKNEKEARAKVLDGKGLRIGLPMRCDDSIEIMDSKPTDLEID